jgi:hypothetical protein
MATDDVDVSPLVVVDRETSGLACDVWPGSESMRFVVESAPFADGFGLLDVPHPANMNTMSAAATIFRGRLVVELVGTNRAYGAQPCPERCFTGARDFTMFRVDVGLARVLGQRYDMTPSGCIS